jgi:hypothetical protein
MQESQQVSLFQIPFVNGKSNRIDIRETSSEREPN